MRQTHVLVAVDVGMQRHRVAVGIPGQRLACEFDLEHTPEGLATFFRRVETYTRGGHLPSTSKCWRAAGACSTSTT